MKVKKVIEMLKELDSDAQLDLSLYPTFLEDALDRYEERDVCNNYKGELQDLFYE